MYTGQGIIAFIDLSNRCVTSTRTPDEVVEKLVGGRGINMYYLHKELRPGVDPLSPENVLIFGAGLLTGTLAPSASRMNISAKSPETGILGDASIGGFFPAEMRLAGFDRLIIHGRAQVPSYLYISDETIQIRDAGEYWGLDVSDTQKAIRKDLGNDVQTVCIGRAGENLVKMACIMSGLKNAAGRCGLGAVMGSKNLKAVVARGNIGIPTYDPQEMIRLRLRLQEYLLKSKVVKVLGAVGTPILYGNSNSIGAIRTHNNQLNTFSENLSALEIEKRVEKMLSCYSCPVHCRHRNIFGGEGPEYSTVGLLGANCGLSDTDQVIKLNNLVNELGLDSSSTGTIIPWAIELYQRGIIDEKITGQPLRFGDYALIESMIRDIAERRGFGNILAESTGAAKLLGDESKKYLIAIKGLPQSDPHDVRYIKSFALGLAVASRGADHLRNRPTLDIMDLPEDLLNEIYGVKIDPDPTSYITKENIVYYHENMYALGDALGICRFITHGFNSPHLLKPEHFVDLIRAATGIESTADGLIGVGKRIIDLERIINLREGVTKKDDTLPERYFTDKLPLKKAAGHHIDRASFLELLDRYYSLRKWNSDGEPDSAVKMAIEQLEGVEERAS